MAGQRARTLDGGTTDGTADGGYPPAQRRAPRDGARPRRADDRRAARAQAPSARPFSGVAVVLSLGLPVAGGLLDQLLGLGIGGWGLLCCSVLGFAGAAAVCSRTGWWWVLPAPPPIVLAVMAATAYLAHSDDYKGGKKLATGAAKWAIQGFPVMLYAIGAALLVILVRTVRDRRSLRG